MSLQIRQRTAEVISDEKDEKIEKVDTIIRRNRMIKNYNYISRTKKQLNREKFGSETFKYECESMIQSACSNDDLGEGEEKMT